MQLARRKRRQRGLQIIPLIDVVMILLIFFMLSSDLLQLRTLPMEVGGGGQGGLPSILKLLGGGKAELNGTALGVEAVQAALPAAMQGHAPRLAVLSSEAASIQDLAQVLDAAAALNIPASVERLK